LKNYKSHEESGFQSLADEESTEGGSIIVLYLNFPHLISLTPFWHVMCLFLIEAFMKCASNIIKFYKYYILFNSND